MKWVVNDSAETLKNYFKEKEEYGQKKSEYPQILEQIDEYENKITDTKKEIEQLESELAVYSSAGPADIGKEIEKLCSEAARKVSEEKEAEQREEALLCAKRDADMAQNDQKLRAKLQEMLGKDADFDRELDASEQKMLEFAKIRHRIYEQRDTEVNKLEDTRQQKELNCKNEVHEIEEKKNDIMMEYASKLEQKQNVINSIVSQYEPILNQSSKKIDSAQVAREAARGKYDTEAKRLKSTYNNQVLRLQTEYKQVDKTFKKEIASLEAQNRATTRKRSSHQTQLNKINLEISKVKNKYEQEVAKINHEWEVVRDGLDKNVAAAKNEFTALSNKKKDALAVPEQQKQQLIAERDGKLAHLDQLIAERESQYKAEADIIMQDIEKHRAVCDEKIRELDAQVLEFSMSGNTCYNEQLEAAYLPFKKLSGKVPAWIETAKELRKFDKKADVDAKCVKEKEQLKVCDYSILMQEVKTAEALPEKDKSIAAKPILMWGIIGALTVVGILALYFLANVSHIAVLLLPVLVGIVLCVVIYIQNGKHFTNYCRAIAVIRDCEEFSAVIDYTRQMTQKAELDRVKQKGEELFELFAGPEEAKRIHAVMRDKILSSYENESEMIKITHKSKRSEIESQLKIDMQKVKEKVKSDAENQQQAMKKVSSMLSQAKDRVAGYCSECERNQNTKEELEKYFEEFENEYAEFEKCLEDVKWSADFARTHGVLDNQFFIVADRKEDVDEYGHRNIYCITHNKKPIIITYDTEGLEDNSGSVKTDDLMKRVNHILEDLIISVNRMNAKQTFEQIIVDNISGGTRFQRTDLRNTFGISASCRQIAEINGKLAALKAEKDYMASNGKTLDQVNEENYQKQAEPKKYTIVYMIYQEKDKGSKLPDSVNQLLSECHKYGFLPVFICNDQMWELGRSQDNNMYNEMQRATDNPVISYSGASYVTSM